jgi:replicative DNA helicase
VQRIEAMDRKLARHERVGDVVRGLKNLSRDLGIPVVALAQVGRQVEQRADKRPGMADLADSGDIEKEADQILTLYREGVYNPDHEHAGTAEISVEKNRHGPTGFVRVAWLKETMRFEDLAHAA